MDGVVLSHTRMGELERGFCTNILVLPSNGEAPYQVRPRLPPNSNLFVTSFGMSEIDLNSWWMPGYRVKLDKFVPVPQKMQRPTHPEDVQVVLAGGQYWHPQVLQTKLSPADFANIIGPLVCPNVRSLYPALNRQDNGKVYVDSGTKLVRSVGYVKAASVVFHADCYDGKTTERCTIVDQSGVLYVLAVKDTEVLRKLGSAIHRYIKHKDVTVRLALSGDFHGKCYVMASHFIF